MTNPFRLRWLQGWIFQVVLMEGHVQVEAHGFGICLRTAVLPGESPQSAADRLVLAEDRRRRALHSAWLRGNLPRPSERPFPPLREAQSERPVSLVVVQQNS
jgi:ferric-dicitrate binding protein FerR (iron transport regulator)